MLENILISHIKIITESWPESAIELNDAEFR